ncbi:tetratricopeptide repeat protein, partial [Oleiphilus sp. HI0066]|uniref:tetratricopeptide repeat protein n=2 Tax=unclassified Oleiphilus TaxID=2631174 RepID=UPI000ABEE3F6
MTINPSNVFAEALTNYQRGQYQKTAQLLNTLLQANIASPDIFNLMASALFRLGDRDNAKKLYLASLKMKPDYAQTHVHAAGFYRQISELDLATQHYVKAFELDQNDRESLMNAALVLQQLERWEASEEVI